MMIFLIFFLLFVFLLCFPTSVENFWNMSTRSTRNQSYDLRGDPFPIQFNPQLSPWNMSSWGYGYGSLASGYPYAPQNVSYNARNPLSYY